MNSKKAVNKILFITLSNIGDCLLSLPVLDLLVGKYPQAQITVMSGPRPKELFCGNPFVKQFIVFDKRAKMGVKIKLFRQLKKEKFDLVVDLRNSLFGALLSPRFNLRAAKDATHMRDRHLGKLGRYALKTIRHSDPVPYGTGEESKNQILRSATGLSQDDGKKNSLYTRPEDEKYIQEILSQNNIKDSDKIIVIASGARSHIKRWPQDKFVGLIASLTREFGAKIVLIGDKDDAAINKYIADRTSLDVLDLSGVTSLRQLAALLKQSSLLITNDSASLHLASYLNVPVVAIFGPTNELQYGPWSEVNAVVKKDISCRPCEKAQCKFGHVKCMEIIQVEDVMRQVRNILENRDRKTGDGSHFFQEKNENRPLVFKRILIVRTDRIGDVLLSTPVIKALRENYPTSFIAMMVSPYASQIVEGNPYLDEVIIFDKDALHKSWQSSFKFVRALKKKKFDLALILHPTNRVHLMTFFAGIVSRIGYNRKFGFLLTDKIIHAKQLGEKHESEYNLDLVRYLGLEIRDRQPLMPIKKESEIWARDFLRDAGIVQSDKLLAIHPGASCPSKIWPNESFAEVADHLIDKYGFKVLIVAGPKDTALAANVLRHMRYPALNLAGKTSVSQMASLLKRCRLFISNDSGPVHIASAIGVPVISIFGRAQAGLGPKRWGPLGPRSRILHKNVGCVECLAHNCLKSFLCLRSITVDDVLESASSLIEERAADDKEN